MLAFMRWVGVCFATTLIFAATAANAVAQSPDAFLEDDADKPFDRACMDDHGRDLCDSDNWGRIVSTFNVDPPDAAWEKGFRGLRVFTVDGHSTDMPMIAVQNIAGGARVEVRSRDDAPDDALTAVVLTHEATPEINTAVRNLHTLVAAAPERQVSGMGDGTNGERITICLHPWVTVTESFTASGVVRRIRKACGSDPLFDASYEISELALGLFAHCNRLDPDNYRNESTQLQRCLWLTGEDRTAAVAVANILDSDAFEKVADLVPHLAPNARVSLPAQATVSALSAAPFDEFDAYAYHLIGRSDGVIATGGIDRYVDEGYEIADLKMVWRNQGGVWRLTDLTIGPITRE